MTTPVEILESRLAAQAGRRHCIAVGRGATALWLMLESVGENQPSRCKVVLPATLCVSPAAVTMLAGFLPVFCDTEPLTGNLDPVALAALLAVHDDIACILAAHMFGQMAKITEIEALARAHGVFVIEDAAQAFGASLGGRPAGGFGDAAIVSFGHTKILDAGSGGALLTDDDALAVRLRERAAALPLPPEELGAWAADYRAGYYALAPEMKNRDDLRRKVADLCALHPGLYRYAITDAIAEDVLTALETLPAELSHRREMAAFYQRELADTGATPLQTTPEGAPWRFNILIPGGRRDQVVGALRVNGFDASAWYPVLAPFFENRPDWRDQLPGAVRIEQEILNLWVDHSTDEIRVRRASAIIRDCLQGRGITR